MPENSLLPRVAPQRCLVGCGLGSFRHKEEYAMPRNLGWFLLPAALLCGALSAWAQDDDKGKALVAARCNSCHPLAARTGSGYDAEGWKTVMRMMTNHGVPIAKDELGPMTDYLIKSFPIKRSSAGLVPGSLKGSVKGRKARTPGA